MRCIWVTLMILVLRVVRPTHKAEGADLTASQVKQEVELSKFVVKPQPLNPPWNPNPQPLRVDSGAVRKPELSQIELEAKSCVLLSELTCKLLTGPIVSGIRECERCLRPQVHARTQSSKGGPVARNPWEARWWGVGQGHFLWRESRMAENLGFSGRFWTKSETQFSGLSDGNWSC